MIRIRNIEKKYVLEGTKKEYKVLKGITLTLPDKGLVSILGPSGCGKTTFLNLLSLLDTPSSGQILFNDVDISKFTEAQKDEFRHYRIGFVYQEYNLVEHLTVFDNVKLAFNIGSTIDANAENKRVLSLLERFNILHLKDRLPSTLSGGEKQRVAISRALANNPGILLADEPTGALDEDSSLEVMSLLKELSSSILVVMVTHNRQLADEYSDRIVALSNGRIVSDNAISIDDKFEPTRKIKHFKHPESVIPLAFKRLIHKRGRYGFLTAINTLSVFTIGVAVAALSGSQIFSNNLQRDTLKSYPVTVSSVYIGTGTSFLTTDAPLYPSDGKIHRIDNDESTTGINTITSEYVEYVKKGFEENDVDADCLTLRKGLTPTILMQGENDEVFSFEASDIAAFTGFDTFFKDAANYFRPFYGGNDQLNETYDLVYGRLPTQDNELIVVLDNHDSFPTHMLDLLGLKGETVEFDTLMAKKFKFVNNDEYYGKPIKAAKDTTAKFAKDPDTLKKEGKQLDEIQNILIEAAQYYRLGGKDNIAKMNEKLIEAEDYFIPEDETRTLSFFRKPSLLDSMFEDENIGHMMTITGIIRPKKEQFFPYLKSGIYYTKAYSDLFLEENSKTVFASEYSQHISFNRKENVLKVPAVYDIIDSAAQTKTSGDSIDINGIYNHILNRKMYGVDDSVYQIEIMAKNFAMKDRAIKVLEQWNKDHKDGGQIAYSDIGGAIMNMIDKYVGILLAVLVAVIVVVIFFSLLVTSLLTILEVNGRKKEIGLYRSLGAKGTFVRSIFLTEQGIVGFISGLLGVSIAFAAVPLINKYIESAVSVAVVSNFAVLHWWAALIIPVVALAISLMSAFFPAVIATKKAPSQTIREI